MVTRFKIENIYIFVDTEVSLGHFKVNRALSACVVIL